MTDREILEKAIQKAIDYGWEAPAKNFHVSDWDENKGAKLDNSLVRYGIWFDTDKAFGSIYHWQDIIYTHVFAKALWGQCSQWYEPMLGDHRIPMNGYEFHLQWMVIDDNPIQYLGESLGYNKTKT